jgi:hypothetical protein
VLPPMQAPASIACPSRVPSSAYAGYFQLQKEDPNARSSALNTAGFHRASGPASMMRTEWPFPLSLGIRQHDSARRNIERNCYYTLLATVIPAKPAPTIT